MRRKWHFGRGLWRIFPIKKYPSTIRGKNGVLIPPFALKNCRKFCSLLYAGKTGFLHPPPAHIFQKNFCPSLYAAKIAIYQPLAEDFVQKICPSLYAEKIAFWQPPYFEKSCKIEAQAKVDHTHSRLRSAYWDNFCFDFNYSWKKSAGI